MIKTGSKFLFGLAAFGLVAAVLWAGGTGRHKIGVDTLIGPLTLGYKGYVGEHTGYAVLVGLSLAALFLAIFLSALRDSDAEAVAQVAGTDTVPEVPVPVTVNYWPAVGAFSLAAIALGLGLGPTLFVIGVIGLTITTAEWAVRAWADRATGDPEVNHAIRNRFLYPVEIPALAVIGIAGTVLAVSRILLALPKVGSYVVFGLVPAIILAVGALIVLKPKLSPSVVAGLLLVLGVAILAGGIVAGIHGERHHGEETKETTGKGESGLGPSLSPTPTGSVIWMAN